MLTVKNNKGKKQLTVILLLVLLLTVSTVPAKLFAAGAEQKLSFVINGVSLMNVPVVTKNNYTLIPIRHFAQLTGATQEKLNNIQAALTKNNLTVTLTNNSGIVTSSEKGTLQSPVTPLTKEGLMYVPLRFLCEQFNIDIRWEAETNTIHLDLDNTRLDMTPPKLLAKTQKICEESAGYHVDSKVSTQLFKADDTLLSSVYVEGSEMVRHEPYTAYLVQTTKNQLTGTAVKNEFLVTEQQIFTKEGDNPWVAGSVNANYLLANRENISSLPITDVTAVSELNPVYTFADDTVYRGQPCYVIQLYFSPAIYQENLEEFLPLLDNIRTNDDLKLLFSGLSIEKFQTIYINKETLQQAGAEIYENIKLHVKGTDEPFARFQTEGELVFSNKPFELPDGIPILKY